MNETEQSYKMLTVDKICELTGIKERKVRGLIKSGFFPRANVPGRQVFVSQEDFEKAMETSRHVFGN